MRVSGVITGAGAPSHWSTSGEGGGAGGGGNDLDQWDLKGLFQVVLSLANRDAVLQVADDAGEWVAVGSDERVVGRARLLSADAPRWAAAVYGFEIEVTPVGHRQLAFVQYPTTPRVERDLALVVPDGIDAATVLAVVGDQAGPLLESSAVVDQYRGPGVPEGARSLAVRLVFRSSERTLRDEEVDSAVRKVCTSLEQRHHVVLRAS